LRERPTAHLSYDEGLHLIRSFLQFASQHTVEELQAFTAQWVPHPQWVKVKEIEVPEETLLESANVLQEQLGPEGIRKVGGRNWWQWRRPGSPLKAEWVEMRSDYNERMKSGDPGTRVMLYVHGGGYFFGSVDEHRYQMQRHARKLKARVFAPEYRLAPQFPFPCGLQDCVAAYLYLLKTQDPSTIILAGDSAGGGMVMSMLVTLRDRGIPLPAGAVLISPWVDLSHSFPSVSGDCPLDYIPPYGFHHKPSQSWPPLNLDEYAILKEQMTKNAKSGKIKSTKPAAAETEHQSQDQNKPTEAGNLDDESPLKSRAETTYLSINIDGDEVLLKDQIQVRYVQLLDYCIPQELTGSRCMQPTNCYHIH
jgi:acetyl esterase/lipase